MSTPEITPELARAVAEWISTHGNTYLAGAVRSMADRVEREQAEEKHIDALVTIFFRAAYQTTGDDTVMSTDDVARGIRAVLDAERDLITDPIEAAEYQEKVLGITQEQAATEARADGYGDPGADPAEEWDRTPRQWASLLDIPSNVRDVTDVNGLTLQRAAFDRLWRGANTDGAPYPCVTTGPYTEIVGGDQ
ncbi:hypothetical protein [Rhodococcus sp. SJ-2]